MKQYSVSILGTGTGERAEWVAVRPMAAKAGLSVATVSRVLNGDGNVAPRTRERSACPAAGLSSQRAQRRAWPGGREPAKHDTGRWPRDQDWIGRDAEDRVPPDRLVWHGIDAFGRRRMARSPLPPAGSEGAGEPSPRHCRTAADSARPVSSGRQLAPRGTPRAKSLIRRRAAQSSCTAGGAADPESRVYGRARLNWHRPRPVPQPRRRRVLARPADQHQPPGVHERTQLPTNKRPKAKTPTTSQRLHRADHRRPVRSDL